MGSVKRFAATALFLLVILRLAAGQSSVPQTPSATFNGSVSGSVLLEGKRLAGIRVFLVSSNRPSFATVTSLVAQAVTNSEGEYRLIGVPPGVFNLLPEPGPYVLPRQGAGFSPGVSVVVQEGGASVQADLELKRGAVISGSVRDSDGQPVIGRHVSILRMNQRGEKQVISTGNQLLETDDRGIYRIYGLEAGKYLVSVSFQRLTLPNNTTSRQSDTPTTYYPGVTELAKATPIEVAAGDSFSNADFVVGPPIESHSVSGEVVNAETGQPVGGVPVTYTELDKSSALSNRFTKTSSTTDEKGRFRLSSIKPGRYALLVQASNSDSYADPVAFEINDENVSDLQVKLRPGSVIAGTVELVGAGGTQPASFPNLSNISILAISTDQTTAGAAQLLASSTVNTDSSFKLVGLKPGTVRLQVNSSPSQDLALLRTELNGLDLGNGIEVRPGEPTLGVRLVIAYGKGNLVGRVTSQSGGIPEGAQISVSATMLNTSPARRSFATVDNTGGFKLPNLAPGEYEISTIMSVPNQQGRPEFQSAKQNVQIVNQQTIEITVVVKPRR